MSVFAHHLVRCVYDWIENVRPWTYNVAREWFHTEYRNDTDDGA